MVKWSNARKRVAHCPTTRCSSYWKGNLRVAFDNSRQLYLLYGYILVLTRGHQFYLGSDFWHNLQYVFILKNAYICNFFPFQEVPITPWDRNKFIMDLPNLKEFFFVSIVYIYIYIYSVHQWSGRPRFNPRSRHTKYGTWCCLA